MAKATGKELLQNFRKASRQYSDTSVLMHEAIARKIGLSGVDHKYLGLIIQHGEMTAGELSKLTGLTTGAVTGLIDRLEQKKLVKRSYDANDRRKVLIVPNEQNATKLLTPVFSKLQQKTDELLGIFSYEEIAIVAKYFEAATGVMQDIADTLNTKKK